MMSACGRYVIAFNGEIYNFEALREELVALGHTFRGHSDTEVLLAAISQWGLTPALQRSNGMFAIALWDREERSLHLVRDRVGEKPLYYGWVGTAFVFGSELKALRAYPEFRGEIDRDALALFMRYCYVPTPFSIYRGIAKLVPGAILTLDGNTQAGCLPEPQPYWSARAVAEQSRERRPAWSPEDATASLDALLRDAVKLRMTADVPLGAFLSGGVDSSTVVALMQTQSARPIRTFSIGFDEPAYNEAAHAAAVARHLGTAHTELYVSPAQAMAVIPDLPALYDEPFADSSQIPTFLVSQLARRQVTVSLSGDGGDELFGGYTRYLLGGEVWRRIGWIPKPFKRAAAGVLTAASSGTWTAILNALAPLIPPTLRVQHPGEKLRKLADVLAKDDPDALYLRLVSIWHEPLSVVQGAVEPPTRLTDRSQWARLPEFINRMMFLDLISYLPDDILVKVDRASMGVSLEARVPLLDHRVVEFAWTLPATFKIRDGQSKWLLRQVLYRYVPPALIDRPKMGFGLPIDSWLRGPLRGWAEDLLDEGRLKKFGLFHAEPVRRKWAEHLSGRQNWQYLLWNVLMAQAWLDR